MNFNALNFIYLITCLIQITRLDLCLSSKSMAKNLSLTIASLHSKVEKLIILNKKNVDDLKRFREENEVLKDDVKRMRKREVELEEKVKVLALAKSLGDNEIGKNELKLKISELVREIDKCIALTNG